MFIWWLVIDSKRALPTLPMLNLPLYKVKTCQSVLLTQQDKFLAGQVLKQFENALVFFVKYVLF